MNITQLAVEILDLSRKEMHVDEIAEQMLKLYPNITFEKDLLAKKLSSSLSSNIKTKQPLFSKVKNKQGGERRGIYRLRRSRKFESNVLPFSEPDQNLDTSFIGKAGEYAVMSELLYKGFNVSLMTVDKGIDVIAAKEDGKYFHIQVKTSTKNSEGMYSFGIKRKAFDANASSQTFYIFVLRKVDRCDFIIMPNSQIANFIALDVIRGTDTLSLRIYYDSKRKKYTLNNKQDITIFVNGFGQIC